MLRFLKTDHRQAGAEAPVELLARGFLDRSCTLRVLFAEVGDIGRNGNLLLDTGALKRLVLL